MRVEDPLSGWPETKPLDKDGFLVEAVYLTPGRARLIHSLTGIVGLGWFVLNVWAALTHAAFETAADFIVVGVAFLILWLVPVMIFKWITGLLLSKTVRVEFWPDVIRIGGGSARYKNYACNVPHTFELAIHDEAQDEAESAQRAEEAARMRGQTLTVNRYYRDSFHVILRYAGQRVDVATVYGKREADALFARLQFLHQKMNAKRGEISGPIRPDTETIWGPRPAVG